MSKYILAVGLICLITLGCKDNPTPPENVKPDSTSTFIKVETPNGRGYELTQNLNGEIGKAVLNGDDVTFVGIGKDSIKISYEGNPLPIRNTIELTMKESNEVATATFLGRPKKIEYKIVESRPHNKSNFTQGLLFDNGTLYESTGLEGRSRIIKYKNTNGKFVEEKSVRNSGDEFGEGISFLGDKLVQLLWKNGYLKIYDKNDLSHIEDLPYANEGWGSTLYNNQLYVSDGSGAISVINIDEKVVRKVFELPIQDNSGGIQNLNELEMVHGKIYANIWQTNNIVIIDPKDGIVEGIINLAEITKKEKANGSRVDVLNGIAYDEKNDELWITGKLWSSFYRIELQNL